ncbi:nitrite reductase [Mesobacillus boroniphilus JCM 21738]|uniref:Nitrite reductase n=1 Tax=Mesobacillus boroniphilus JCM 21738 TaxID=1294265 RepID=W4RL81_9BACI|nr:nitrite reductase [Mesobacillus boroniphilus JCM 21738]
MEITGAYLQYYRETAAYLERTAPWLERMGLNHVKEVLADENMRKQLNERLDKTLERYNEPWHEAITDSGIKEKYYQVRSVTVE